jgi:hypothetical protein
VAALTGHCHKYADHEHRSLAGVDHIRFSFTRATLRIWAWLAEVVERQHDSTNQGVVAHQDLLH